MKIAISIESTADLPADIRKKYNLHLIEYSVLLGDKSHIDSELKPAEIFEYVSKNKTLPKTSAVNEEQFTDYFSDLLKNYDAIIHLSLSSSLSATYAQAKLAAEKFKNVFVVDSLSLASGIGLLAIYAAEEIESNTDITAEELYNKCLIRVPYVQTSFVIERLDYLYKGGRCSGLQLLGANLLRLRPQIYMKDGKLAVGKKYTGKMHQVVKKYCDDTLSVYNTPDLTHAFVEYTTATPEMIDAAKTALKNAGFKNIHEIFAGCTISAHCGEHTLGILYINDGKR